MKKHTPVLIVLTLFLIFSSYFLLKQGSYTVLKVDNPHHVYVDLNNNGVVDDGEEISLLDDFQCITKDNINDENWDTLNLDEYTRYAFCYLTEKYVNDVLLDKKVNLNEKEKKELLLSGESFTDIMAKSGYLFKNNLPVNKISFEKRLEQIKKNEYKLYNLKSNKYHLLTCEFGKQAHNYIVLSKYQIPKGAKRCKYCLDHSAQNPKSQISCKVPLSMTSGAIKVFLTDYTNNLKPNRSGNTQICNELVRQIDSAKNTVDIAIYGYDKVPKIEQALKKAVKRGVKVRIVYDTDASGNNIYAHTKYFVNMFKGAVCDKPTKECKNPVAYSNSIMHNKFYIFDNTIVMTGSANLSYTDMSDYNANCVILFNSKKVADVYTREFEQMYNSRFHELKSKINEKENINIGNSTVSIYFSPKDEGIKNVLVPLIDSANKYIYMPVFLITDKRLAQALINAKSRGVDIKIIVDATNAKSTYSKHRLLRQHGIHVKTENFAGKLHSKSIIIDDKYAVIGSMNFSKSGEMKNDENMVVIKNQQITLFYKKYFMYLWGRIKDYWLYHDVSAESVYSYGSCSDGIDNDYDGKTDMEDEGCKMKVKSGF